MICHVLLLISIRKPLLTQNTPPEEAGSSLCEIPYNVGSRFNQIKLAQPSNKSGWYNDRRFLLPHPYHTGEIPAPHRV